MPSSLLTIIAPFFLLLPSPFGQAAYPILTSSFTWNQICGPTVACGPLAAGIPGIGYAAANNVTYAAGAPIVGGVGAGCGQCWHLQPVSDVYESNGLRLGTPVVVKINDQCTDPGYCDQLEYGNEKNLNTKFGKQVHFDLCNATGVTDQFFGEVGIGVALGFARRLSSCDDLDKGKFGSGMGLVIGGKGDDGDVDDAFVLKQPSLAAGNVGEKTTLVPVASSAVAVAADGGKLLVGARPVVVHQYDAQDNDAQDDCEEL